MKILSPFQLFAVLSRFFSFFEYKVAIVAPDMPIFFGKDEQNYSTILGTGSCFLALRVGLGGYFWMKTGPPYTGTFS